MFIIASGLMVRDIQNLQEPPPLSIRDVILSVLPSGKTKVSETSDDELHYSQRERGESVGF